MSTISSIALLNKFSIKEVGALEERVVELGMNQAVNILKASLQSKMVLTSVFLKKATGSDSGTEIRPALHSREHSNVGGCIYLR
ncbi:hypothetical protein Fmac_022957 [Flemingia macrophylla]|uniref:Uncharacterized protein n=1 Tax=Flemingia macrophylla TaxID=520843 RepID=A0ABD1LK47_9FABA